MCVGVMTFVKISARCKTWELACRLCKQIPSREGNGFESGICCFEIRGSVNPLASRAVPRVRAILNTFITLVSNALMSLSCHDCLRSIWTSIDFTLLSTYHPDTHGGGILFVERALSRKCLNRDEFIQFSIKICFFCYSCFYEK